MCTCATTAQLQQCMCVESKFINNVERKIVQSLQKIKEKKSGEKNSGVRPQNIVNKK